MSEYISVIRISYAPALRGNLPVEQLLSNHPILAVEPKRLKRFIPMRTPKRQLEISSEFQLRRATSRDGETIQRWISLSNQELGESFDVIPTDVIESREIYLLENKSQGQAIGGFFRTVANDNRYWLARFYLFTEYRSQGLGRVLFDAALNDLTSQAEMHLHVVSTNSNAIAFYKKMGMEEIELGFNAQLI